MIIVIIITTVFFCYHELMLSPFSGTQKCKSMNKTVILLLFFLCYYYVLCHYFQVRERWNENVHEALLAQ